MMVGDVARKHMLREWVKPLLLMVECHVELLLHLMLVMQVLVDLV